MIRVRLQIADSPIEDTFSRWGFIYMSSDNRTEAPIKKREVTSYAEEAGEHIDPRTVQDAFDYKVKFLIECPNRNLLNANAKIAAFNKALYTQSKNGDVRTYKKVAFYNDYKRVKIVGIPEPIAEPTELYRRQDGTVMDCAQIEWIIRVVNPTECDFDTQTIDTSFMRVGGDVKNIPYISYTYYEREGDVDITIFGTMEPYRPDLESIDTGFLIQAYYPQNEQPYGTLGVILNDVEYGLALTASEFNIDIPNNLLRVHVPELIGVEGAHPEIQIMSDGLQFVDVTEPESPVGHVKAGNVVREFKYIYYGYVGDGVVVYGLTEPIVGDSPDPATIAFMFTDEMGDKHLYVVVNEVTHHAVINSSDECLVNIEESVISIRTTVTSENLSLEVTSQDIPFVEVKD